MVCRQLTFTLKHFFMMRLLLLFAVAGLWWTGCKSTEDPSWAAFKQCGSNACVQEALAVKTAFVKNPGGLLKDFLRTYQQGEDHLIGWLYLLRDSVLTQPQAGSYEERIRWREEILNAAQPYAQDAQLGEIARVIIQEMASIAFAEETEAVLPFSESAVFTGTYMLVDGYGGTTGELRIGQLGGDSLRFRLLAVGPAPAHNQGEIEGRAVLLSGREAFFSTQAFGDTCSLRFQWSGDEVRVGTGKVDPPTCGLGAGVVPDGRYSRKSYADPFLSAADAKKAALLGGEWQSAQDAQVTIRIGEGRLFQYYAGEEVEPPVPCLYFPKCPAGCSPAAKVPCLKVIGQDEVCYAVVKADGKTLELSLIGGTGAINRYVRKK